MISKHFASPPRSQWAANALRVLALTPWFRDSLPRLCYDASLHSIVLFEPSYRYWSKLMRRSQVTGFSCILKFIYLDHRLESMHMWALNSALTQNVVLFSLIW